MKLTNKFNLPQPLVSAIENDPYKQVGDISVTGLISAPRKRQLEIRHKDDITEDASDRIWMLLGTSVHAILERADTRNHLAEERLTAEVLGWVVSGQPDLLGPDGVLTDWKVTSVFSFLLGDKPEWEQQLNCYAWLYRKNGFEVTKLQIVAILRDFMQSRASQDPDYPQCAVMVVDVPMWSQEEAQAYIEARVRLHQQAEFMMDDELYNCSKQERWERPTTFAVMRASNKKATRVFNLDIEAEHFVNQHEKPDQYEIVKRPGESVRCARFCNALPWCYQGTALLMKEMKDAAL